MDTVFYVLFKKPVQICFFTLPSLVFTHYSNEKQNKQFSDTKHVLVDQVHFR